MERNKLQLPLLTHIALLFILAALVATIGVWLFSRRYWIESAAEQSGRQAKSAALLARMALADTDPDFLTQEDEEMREDMHQIFRNLCKEIDLTYLYLFTVDDEGVRHHLISAADSDEEDAALNAVAGYGTVIEHDPLFPNRTNTEFAKILPGDRIRMRVWERGAGETMACGTGACATLVAAAANGLTGRKAILELNGGNLLIEWDNATNHIFQEGPAEFVFDGVWPG